MKFLKGFALFILGLLLSLSIFIFGFLLTVNQTALNPNFVISQVNSLDIPSLAEEAFSEEVPQGQEYMSELVVNAASETIAEQETWIKQQTDVATYAFYDYLEGRSQGLSLAIPLDPIKESLRDNLWEAVLESPPPEFAGLSPAEVEQEFNQFWSEFSTDIPSTIDETSIPSGVMTGLEQARQYIGYFHIAFFSLIGLIMLLILGIILVHHQVRGATRGLGTIFLTDGAITLIGVLLAKNLARPQLAKLVSDSLPTLQESIKQLFNNTLAPLQWFSIGLMAAGVVLLIVSFVYKPHQPSAYTAGL